MTISRCKRVGSFLISVLSRPDTLSNTGTLARLMFGKNPIYHNVRHGEEEKYQSYFMKIIDLVDVKNLTAQACGKPFAAETASRDLNTIHHLANQAGKLHLHPSVIEIMVMQYIYADPGLREQDKKSWIYKVMAPSRQAYFPDAVDMYFVLYGS